MIAATASILWLFVLLVAVAVLAVGERRSRLSRSVHRPEQGAPRRDWGGQSVRPPATWAAVRALAGLAHQTHCGATAVDASVAMRRWGRGVTFLALSTALALTPVAATTGAALDLASGLAAIVLLLLLASLGQVVAALSERSLWSRLDATRRVSRALVGAPLLLLALAPIALAAGSLRLHDIVLLQQGSIAPLALVSGDPATSGVAALGWLGWPRWLIFQQPISALLFLPAFALMLRRSDSVGGVAGMPCVGGYGLDADPGDLHWTRVESRLVRLLAASLFVVLFLGAGGLLLEPDAVVRSVEPFVGRGVGLALATGLEIGVFVAKLAAVLAAAWLVRESSARLRDDQLLGIAARRLMPLAWANALLMLALHLIGREIGGGGG